DAVADLLTAESVYQLVRGNTGAAVATLDSMSQGNRPPEPQIAHLPRGGTTLTHRFAIVVGGDAQHLREGWPPAATPRAEAEPYIDGWVASLLGDPRIVRCRVRYRAVESDTPTETTVTLADLEIRPLDVLGLARSVQQGAADTELDRRVLVAAIGDVSE